jgi:hypothetical protein
LAESPSSTRSSWMSSDDASLTREILKFLCIRYLREDDTFFSVHL